MGSLFNSMTYLDSHNYTTHGEENELLGFNSKYLNQYFLSSATDYSILKSLDPDLQNNKKLSAEIQSVKNKNLAMEQTARDNYSKKVNEIIKTMNYTSGILILFYMIFFTKMGQIE